MEQIIEQLLEKCKKEFSNLGIKYGLQFQRKQKS